jgi:hypothetical protein
VGRGRRGVHWRRPAALPGLCVRVAGPYRQGNGRPLDLDQWVFYVLSTAVLDGRTRSQHSITLKTLEGLTAAVRFGELRQAVNLAAGPVTPS